MSYETLEGQRHDVVDAILGKFGASIEEAEKKAASKSGDPSMQKLTAARVALEYAVLATAREKNIASETVAGALHASTAEQQASMVRAGAAALGRAYQLEPEVLANVFAGHIVTVDVPKGLASTPEIDKMVDACRSLVTGIALNEYVGLSRFDGRGFRGDSFLALKSEGRVSPAKSELAARLAFMEASVDSAVRRGAITKPNDQMLKERIEAQVFQPRLPEPTKFSREFSTFFQQRGLGLRIEAMKAVRGVTQSLTVQEIAAKLKPILAAALWSDRKGDQRAQAPRER